MEAIDTVSSSDILKQLCGFRVGDAFFAIPVVEVQEVIRPQKITNVPLSDPYILGLINLRGQIVTCLSLRAMFGLKDDSSEDQMNIIVKDGDSLYALVVDEILDVIDMEEESFENTPPTLDTKIKEYVSGVHKLESKLLIVLSLEKVFNNKGNVEIESTNS